MSDDFPLCAVGMWDVGWNFCLSFPCPASALMLISSEKL